MKEIERSDLIERVARAMYVQHRFVPGVGDDETLPAWEDLDQWKRDAWIAEAGDLFHWDELQQPRPQGDRAPIDTKLRRWGAAGELEMETATAGDSEDAIRMFVNLQLNTLGPLDRCELTLTRRRE